MKPGDRVTLVRNFWGQWPHIARDKTTGRAYWVWAGPPYRWSKIFGGVMLSDTVLGGELSAEALDHWQKARGAERVFQTVEYPLKTKPNQRSKP